MTLNLCHGLRGQRCRRIGSKDRIELVRVGRISHREDVIDTTSNEPKPGRRLEFCRPLGHDLQERRITRSFYSRCEHPGRGRSRLKPVFHDQRTGLPIGHHVEHPYEDVGIARRRIHDIRVLTGTPQQGCRDDRYGQNSKGHLWLGWLHTPSTNRKLRYLHVKERLLALIDEFASLEQALNDPEVINDQKKLRDVSRDYKHKQPIVEKAREYLDLAKRLEDNESLLDDKSLDPDLRDLAHEESHELKEGMATLDEELKVAARPPRPERLQELHHGDPRRHRWRRSSHLCRRPLQPCIRSTPTPSATA